MKPHVLAIDLGTSGPKVALVCLEGSLAAAAAGSVAIQRAGAAAWQDAEAVWQSVCQAVGEVVRRAALPPEAIVAVTCDSQYFSVVPVDADARPVGDLILWMDTRGATYNHRLYERHPEAFERWIEIHGMVPLPNGVDSLAHTLFVQAEQPEVYAAAHSFLEPQDYVLARLCATHAASPCSAFAQLLTDNRDPLHPRYDDDLIAMAGLDRDKLPPLVGVDAWIGTLRPSVARELGLRPDLPVLAGINDTQAASIAAATFLPGVGGLSVGTTSQVLAHVAGKRSDLDNEIISMPSPIPGRHLAMAENGLGAKTLDHFLHHIAFATDALADHSFATPFGGVEAALAHTAGDAGRVMFLPWLNGSGSPQSSTHARGGFLNLSLDTTREHLVRAILEGVACNLRWLLPAVESFAETRFESLRFSGGGAVSDGWAQIMADVMDRPVAQLADARHANNRASALLAFRKLGMCEWEDVRRLCPVRRTYDPRPAWRERYDLLFEQFRAAFDQLLPIFRALNA